MTDINVDSSKNIRGLSIFYMWHVHSLLLSSATSANSSSKFSAESNNSSIRSTSPSEKDSIIGYVGQSFENILLNAI